MYAGRINIVVLVTQFKSNEGWHRNLETVCLLIALFIQNSPSVSYVIIQSLPHINVWPYLCAKLLKKYEPYGILINYAKWKGYRGIR